MLFILATEAIPIISEFSTSGVYIQSAMSKHSIHYYIKCILIKSQNTLCQSRLNISKLICATNSWDFNFVAKIKALTNRSVYENYSLQYNVCGKLIFIMCLA